MYPAQLSSGTFFAGGLIENQLLTKYNIDLKSYAFDTKRLPACNIEWPLAAILLYIATILIFSKSRAQAAKEKKERDLEKEKARQQKKKAVKKRLRFRQTFALSLHNLLLCVFSALCFYRTFPIVYRLFLGGWENAMCGGFAREFAGDYGYWSYLFYLSKYYEFIDTFIVMWKGRRPIFLQKYHHIGAVIGLWIIICSKSTAGYIFMVLNSFIHTIMYAYYALTVWKIKVPCKFVITILQMIQFVSGLSLGSFQLWTYDCLTPSDRFCISYHLAYVSVLFWLFRRFYSKTYNDKQTAAAAAKLKKS
jgi:hypothetical protein